MSELSGEVPKAKRHKSASAVAMELSSSSSSSSSPTPVLVSTVASLSSPFPSLSSSSQSSDPSVTAAAATTGSLLCRSSPAADGLLASSLALPHDLLTRLPASAFRELDPLLTSYRPEAQDGKADSDAVQALLQQAAAAAPGLMARLGGLGSRAPLLAVALSVSSASPGAVHPLYDSLQCTASLLLRAQSSHQLQAAYAQLPLQELWAELQSFMQLVLAAMRRDGELSGLWTDRQHQPELSAIQSRLQAAEQRLRLALSWDSNHAVHRMEDEVKQTRHEVKETRQAVSQLSASISPPHAAPAAPVIDEQAYAEAVKRACTRLGGMMDALQRGPQHSSVGLQDVFVAQRVKLLDVFSFTSDIELPAERVKRLRMSGQLEPLEPDPLQRRQRQNQFSSTRRSRSVMEVLGDASLRWLVILGSPGSGKSSALRAHLLAWAAASPARRGWLDFPVLVELKKYARDRHPGSTLLQYMSEGGEAHLRLGIKALKAMLQPSSGRGVLLLLDGLDEVFDVRLRAQVVEDVQRFVNEHRGAAVRVVLTSRIVGYSVTELQAYDFAHYILQPLDRHQISDFVRRWHASVYTEVEKETRQNRQARLAKAFSQTGLRQLASSPLLLSMICLVNDSRELPAQRASLYAECSRLLLERWKTDDAVQAVEKTAGMSITLFTRAHKEALLADLAWRMLRDGKRLVNLVPQDVLEAVVLQHVQLQGLRRAEPKLVVQALITQLRERHHVLCWLGGQSFAFVHRTFLEYYAALHVQQQWEAGRMSQAQLVQLFLQRARHHDWREVLLLASAMLPSERVYGCLEALAQDKRDLQGHRLLAARCFTQLQKRDEAAAVERLIRTELEAAVRQHGYSVQIKLLVELWPDDRTRTLLESLLEHMGNSFIFGRADLARTLARTWHDEGTRALLERAVGTQSSAAVSAVRVLAQSWRDDRTRALLETAAGSRADFAWVAVNELAKVAEWRNDSLRKLMEDIARSQGRSAGAAVLQLAQCWRDQRTRSLLEEVAAASTPSQAASEDSEETREASHRAYVAMLGLSWLERRLDAGSAGPHR